jgi:hypothetical protein
MPRMSQYGAASRASALPRPVVASPRHAPGEGVASAAGSPCSRSSCAASGRWGLLLAMGLGVAPLEAAGEDMIDDRSTDSRSCSSAAAVPNASGSVSPSCCPLPCPDSCSSVCVPGVAAAAAAASQLLVLVSADKGGWRRAAGEAAGSAAAGAGGCQGEPSEDAGTDVKEVREVREVREESTLWAAVLGSLRLPCAPAAAAAGAAPAAAAALCSSDTDTELRLICWVMNEGGDSACRPRLGLSSSSSPGEPAARRGRGGQGAAWAPRSAAPDCSRE